MVRHNMHAPDSSEGLGFNTSSASHRLELVVLRVLPTCIDYI